MGPPPQEQEAGDLSWGDCSLAVDGTDLRCGTFTTSARAGDPGAPLIELPVVVVPSTSATPAPDPIVFLTGGPGESAMTYLAELAGASSLRAHRDVIVVEQRGNTGAVPSLTCPEAAGPADVAGLLACRDRLAGDGIDLRDYTTAAAADDIDGLRRALDLPAVNLYGVSYGTRVALEVLRRHPGTVRAAVLDSPYPPTVDNTVDLPRSALDQLSTVLEECARQPSCARAHPDPAGQLAAAVQALNVQPHDTGEGVVSGKDLWQALVRGLYAPEVLPRVPAAVHLAATGDVPGAMAALTPPARPLPAGLTGPGLALGLQLAVLCGDEAPFDSPPGGPLGTRAPWPGPVLSAARYPQQLVTTACRALALPPSGPEQAEPVTSETPTMLIVGEHDPATPPDLAAEAARTLAGAVVVTVPQASHYPTALPCPQELAAAFLDTRAGGAGTDCLAAAGPLRFDA